MNVKDALSLAAIGLASCTYNPPPEEQYNFFFDLNVTFALQSGEDQEISSCDIELFDSNLVRIDSTDSTVFLSKETGYEAFVKVDNFKEGDVLSIQKLKEGVVGWDTIEEIPLSEGSIDDLIRVQFDPGGLYRIVVQQESHSSCILTVLTPDAE
ncbi:MAG: hypothetical protein D6780_06945 [Candidatus Dadabacteria bacterium]|nr:MAG: hypothetical protein D6780_06945 [Candidatus Dadabacteria bacterium]